MRSSTWRVGATSSAKGAAARPTARSATASASPRSIRRARTCSSSASSREERSEPPDIDVDFEHERREEVIQEIYETLRPRSRGDGQRGHLLPRQERAPRGRQGLRVLARAGRSPQRRSSRIGIRQTSAERDASREQRASIPTTRASRRCSRLPASSRASRAISRSTSAASSSPSSPLVDVAPVEPARDGRSHRHPVGQGRHRHARLLQGRRARPRHAHRHPQGARSSIRRTRRTNFDPI